MIDEQAMDVRLASWLEDGPTTAATWVTETVLAHARQHPGTRSIRVRWGDALKSVTAQRRLTVTFRPLLVMLALVAMLALAGVGYLASRQNVVVPPMPSPSPSPTWTASPAPEGDLACARGTSPDQPGPTDQARPARSYDKHGEIDSDWRAVIDSESQQLVLVSGRDIWAFDLCTNTWRKTESTIADGGAPVYDPAADLIVFVEPDEIATYDVDTDTVAMVGGTPVAGRWQVDYDWVTELVVARDERTSRMWTYDVRAAAWREIAQAGDVPPRIDECDTWAEQALAYDASQDRLVLYYGTVTCHGTQGPNTYEFDLASATWRLQPDTAPHFGVFDWGGPLVQLAYDASAQRSVLYSVDRLAAYDAARHAWADAFITPAERVDGGAYNHYRVALTYDPANQRTVLVGSDLLGTAGPGFGAWVIFNDVTAIDLATGMATELLAGQSTPIVERTIDAAGDASPASDIVLVTTSVADGVLTLKVTLVQDWPTVTDGYVLFVEWSPSSGSSGFGAACNPYVATYRSLIASDGTVSGSLPLKAGQKAEISGHALTLTVPLEAFDNPTTLGFALSTPSQRGDSFPDNARGTECHDIPLGPAAGQ